MLPSRWRGSCGSVLELLRIRTPTPRFHPWTIRDHLYEEAAMDPVSLSRLQFAVTTIYHFFFVPLTIGLGPLVAVMHTLYFRTGKEVYKRATKFWGTLFLINFAMGVVTGIVQEFQFGLNWAGYSRFMGDIFGAPLAIEALLAFFLESVFLGLWIFGWDKLPPKLHAACMWLVAVGTLL